MPITHRRSFRVLPGVRVTLRRRSWTVSVGPRNGPHHTWTSAGRRVTRYDLPGPFGYRRSTRTRRRNTRRNTRSAGG